MSARSAAAARERHTASTTYTSADIARLAGCSERHVRRLAARGLVPGRIRGLGSLVRYSRAAVDAWLAGRPAGGRHE
jgi:excisionase family DNA binding protein